MTVTAKDRLIFTLSALKGYSVDVQLTSGLLLNGVLADTREIESHIVLAYAWTRFLTPRGPNGEEPKKAPRKKPDKLKKVMLEDIAWIQAFNVGMSDLALGPSRMNDMNDFTDGGISKGATGQNRTLVAWTPGDDDTSANVGGLEDGQGGGGRSNGRFDTKGGAWGRRAPPGQWDQFAANKQLFGVETKFDESVYTTQIDKSKIGISEEEAARIAREIEGKVSSNPHVAEERNQKLISDFDDDEEAKYSSVSRAPGSEGFKAAPPPSKPAWGSTAGKVPASVASMADAKKTTAESTAPMAQQAPTAPVTEAKKTPTGSKLSTDAPAFTLSAKASAFIPTKKPAVAVAAPPMQSQDAISAAQRAVIMNYQAQMAQMNMMMGYGMGPGAPYVNPMMQYAPQMHVGGQFGGDGGMHHMGGGGYQRGGFQHHQQQHYQQRQNFQPQQQQMKQPPPPAAAAEEQQTPSSD